MDYYLKAESEEALWSALEAAGLAGESEGRKYAKGVSLDVIGLIYKGTGNMIEVNSPEMGTYTYEEQAPIEGFHANIRGDLTAEQQAILPLISKPNAPVRIWFGD